MGQIIPKKVGEKIDYPFVPGPFTNALEYAFKHPEKNCALIIEEINRGNAAAIFGDIFQLLDRKTDGESEYKITNENIYNYLTEKIDKDVFKGEKIYLPKLICLECRFIFMAAQKSSGFTFGGVLYFALSQ